MQKAREGVAVRVQYDDLANFRRKHFYGELKQAGVRVEPFLALNLPFLSADSNFRNHRKVVVVDGRVGFVGGMNIALRYVKGTKTQPWRDTMVKVTGTEVHALQRAFLIDWYFVDRTLINDRKYYPSTLTASSSSLSSMQMVTSGPDSPQPEIMQDYVRTIIG